MKIRTLGLLSYRDGLRQMEQTRARVEAGGQDEILLLEHESVVTLGKRGGDWDRARLERLGTPVIQTDRGGLATWHGPGQLVAYPMVNLRRMRRTVPEFVGLLGEAMVGVAREAGVQGVSYDPDRPGVYVEGKKLGAIGLHIQRGITTHGLALNVCCSLEGFQAIVPCGLTGVGVTTLSMETGVDHTVPWAFETLSRLLRTLLEGRRPTDILSPGLPPSESGGAIGGR